MNNEYTKKYKKSQVKPYGFEYCIMDLNKSNKNDLFN